ncbi:MAG: BamA/TamA family outer membrane protein [Acidobacteriota bacterium]|nr:BamA/TamA family outer membrane protein [Acidobacteriota bacterium]
MAGVRRPLRFLFVALAICLVVQGAVGAQYYDYFGKNKVRYAKFDWRVYHAPHFEVWYYPEEEHLLEKVISLAESAYDSLSQELDFQIQQPTPLIIYKTHTDFLQNNLMVQFIPEGVGAFATPNHFRMVMPIDLPDPELYNLIRHELTHIFQYHILFSGSLGKSLTAAPPQWFMEGMASFYAKDETANDRMYLIDAVVNDLLPPITTGGPRGFLAYRYGHAVFEFIEDRWGADGLQDFLYEFRNTLGARVGRAVERAFRVDPEDFDAEFRRWLRQRYLPELIEHGEPSDYGRPFRTQESRSQEMSPIAAPSGDLVAAFSTLKGDVDIVLFDAERRRFLRNLTKGSTTRFNNLIAQGLTIGRRMGRDIAFAPDGNYVASFASKREAGRALVLVDVLKGGIERVIDMEVEQQQSPAWSPDGQKIAFSGNTEGVFDIFLLDVDTLEIQNITNDAVFDGSPSFSPDGSTIIFSSVIGEKAQIFAVNLDTGARRHMVSQNSNDIDPIFSSDGGTIYFTSDRDGADNIYSVEVASGEITQHTNAVTGCFMPAVISQPDGSDDLVFTGYWKGRFDLYLLDLDEPIGETQLAEVEDVEPVSAEDLPVFEPDIQITLDEENKEKRSGFKLFLEDAGGGVGVDDDQTFVGLVYLQFADFLGDRRLTTIFSSISDFSNFDVQYVNQSRRTHRQYRVFDYRYFFRGNDYDPFTGGFTRGDEAYKETGVSYTLSRPFSFYRRGTVGVGYTLRDISYQSFALISDPSTVDPEFEDQIVQDPNTGDFFVPTIVPREDDFPIVNTSLVGDTTVYAPWGPVRGHRYMLYADYAPDTDVSGTLTNSYTLDVRQYVPMSARTGLAFRLWGGRSSGHFPRQFYIGGFDQIRGLEYRDLVGEAAFYGNIELRFPLIDVLAFPGIALQGIRGRIFFDVGGAWFPDIQGFRFYNSDLNRLENAIAAYGFGITVRLFGLNLNWDFAEVGDLDVMSDRRTTFWIGQRF